MEQSRSFRNSQFDLHLLLHSKMRIYSFFCPTYCSFTSRVDFNPEREQNLMWTLRRKKILVNRVCIFVHELYSAIINKPFPHWQVVVNDNN